MRGAVATGVIAGAVLWGAAVPIGAAEANSGLSGQIGYGCDGEGCVIGADGSTPHVILGNAQQAGAGVLSPDGTRQAVFDLPPGASDTSQTYELLIGDATGGPLTAAATVDGIPIGNPVWNPAGTELAYQLAAEAPGDQLVWQLWTIGASGANPHLLYSSSYDDITAASPTWNPTGTTLAFETAASDTSHALSTIPAAGGVPTQLSPLGDQFLISLSWSPTGSTILAVDLTPEVNGAKPADQSSLVTFPSAGGAPTTLLPGAHYQTPYESAYYSPDGTAMVLTETAGLVIANAQAQQPHLLLASPGDQATGWSRTPTGQPAALQSGSPGYDLIASDGGVFSFSSPFRGSLGVTRLNAPIVGAASTFDGRGYWLVAADGGVFSFGDAAFYGSPVGHITAPIVGIAAAPFGGGYYLAGADGNVYGFHAYVPSTLLGQHLNAPIVGIATLGPNDGYWLVGADGGVYSFGAPFHGSTGNIKLSKPIVGITGDPATGGYWLTASDGGVFSFDTPFYGSTGNIKLNKPVIGMAFDPVTGGYWLTASDGGVFSFDAPFFGSTGNRKLNAPMVAITSPFNQDLPNS